MTVKVYYCRAVPVTVMKLTWSCHPLQTSGVPLCSELTTDTSGHVEGSPSNLERNRKWVSQLKWKLPSAKFWPLVFQVHICVICGTPIGRAWKCFSRPFLKHSLKISTEFYDDWTNVTELSPSHCSFVKWMCITRCCIPNLMLIDSILKTQKSLFFNTCFLAQNPSWQSYVIVAQRVRIKCQSNNICLIV